MTNSDGLSSSMARALELARMVLGTTSPNPAVGAVVVRDGRIVGEGATQPPGGPHAEVMALRAAGEAARGATLYVTLEPCCTHGRTPACTDAILAAGITQVIVASGDPDPRVDGRGIARLKEANVVVQSGDGAAEVRRHYEPYAHHRRHQRPFVTAKFAASLDGKIAATSGHSRWVSSVETRALAHRLRPTFDAILVGVDTVLLDDPELTARPNDAVEGPQPLRVILDSKGRTPPQARALRDQSRARTLIATTAQSSADWRATIEASGVTVVVTEAEAGRVALQPLLDRLAQEYGIVSLLVEGGGRVHGSFFDAGLVNRVQAVIAPMIIGGNAATAVAGRGAGRMADAVRLYDLSVERVGEDLLISGTPVPKAPATHAVVRPAGAADHEGYCALIADPARRAEVAALLAAKLVSSARGEGNVWVAVDGERIVGGITLQYDTELSESDQLRTAALDLFFVAPEWQHHGLADRLLDSAEASAAGRNVRWLTTSMHAPRDSGCWTREEWRKHGYRYYRRAADDMLTLIKELPQA